MPQVTTSLAVTASLGVAGAVPAGRRAAITAALEKTQIECREAIARESHHGDYRHQAKLPVRPHHASGMMSIARTAIALATIGLLAVGCGDGGGSDESNPTASVAPGFFGGRTRQGEPMSLEVGADATILTIQVSCGGPAFTVFDDVNQPIDSDGSFTAQPMQGSRSLTVAGTFLDQNRVTGTVDGDPFCDGKFDAQRCEHFQPGCVVSTPTPTPTATWTPTVTPTGLTPTPAVTETPRPIATETSHPTPTPGCGNGVVEDEEQCDGDDLDDSDCADFCDEQGGRLSCKTDCTFDVSRCTKHPCEIP